MSALVAYLLAALVAWAPLSPSRLHGEAPAHARRRYELHAQAIASVALDAQETELRGGRVRTALLLASIAFWESGFAELVDEGHCAPHSCDWGTAWSVYQIHDGGGLTLDGAGWRYASMRAPSWLLEHADSVVRGPDLVGDRQLAARVALHMLRATPGAWSTWRTARAHADFWLAHHPAPPSSP